MKGVRTTSTDLDQAAEVGAGARTPGDTRTRIAAVRIGRRGAHATPQEGVDAARLTLCLYMLSFVLAGCADSTDSEPGELLARKAAALDPIETAAGAESPQPPASVAQSMSSTVFRDEVVAAHGKWVVSRTANAEGTFMLVRNGTDASGEAGVVRAARGGEDAETLGPRETTVWECDDVAVPVALRTDDGTVIYDGPLECGDALYVRRGAVVSNTLR